ncbi:hypothetical protein RRG08_060753 [Elysia crispata]|uniref:Uncharacterized protein n=1 Tax=Elysia crispata TaxID=231223 RepID=A0AAE1CXB8_9GAST|nr:hypothetical protein RRG08_060753 [Elysia crispata]
MARIAALSPRGPGTAHGTHCCTHPTPARRMQHAACSLTQMTEASSVRLAVRAAAGPLVSGQLIKGQPCQAALPVQCPAVKRSKRGDLILCADIILHRLRNNQGWKPIESNERVRDRSVKPLRMMGGPHLWSKRVFPLRSILLTYMPYTEQCSLDDFQTAWATSGKNKMANLMKNEEEEETELKMPRMSKSNLYLNTHQVDLYRLTDLTHHCGLVGHCGWQEKLFHRSSI